MGNAEYMGYTKGTYRDADIYCHPHAPPLGRDTLPATGVALRWWLRPELPREPVQPEQRRRRWWRRLLAQNCRGSQCNQNNIAGGAGRFGGFGGAGPTGGGFRFPPTNFNNQVQNCQGSQCNQNNAGGGFGGFPFGK